jgi:hypothetical protein
MVLDVEVKSEVEGCEEGERETNWQEKAYLLTRNLAWQPRCLVSSVTGEQLAIHM